MKSSLLVRWFFALQVICLAAVTGAAHGQVDVMLTRVGNPIWRPIDFHLFTAPAGSQEGFDATMRSILPDYFAGVPTPPPYEKHVAERFAAIGLQDSTTFVPTDIDNQPNAVFIVYSLVPDPGTIGSAYDFTAGPVIPNNILPISVDGELVRNGVVIDPEFDSLVVRDDSFDGLSWILLYSGAAASFFPSGTGPIGSYELRFVQRDQGSNGWNFVIGFQVVPEPSAMVLAASTLAVATGWACRTRKT
jgi:hypothetical protein